MQPRRAVEQPAAAPSCADLLAAMGLTPLSADITELPDEPHVLLVYADWCKYCRETVQELAETDFRWTKGDTLKAYFVTSSHAIVAELPEFRGLPHLEGHIVAEQPLLRTVVEGLPLVLKHMRSLA